MPTQPEARSLKGAVLTIKDGATPTPNSLVLRLLEGSVNLKVGIPEKITIEDRGAISHKIEGKDVETEWSMAFKLEQLEGDSGDPVVTPWEAMHASGLASSWKTTGSTKVYEFDLYLEWPEQATPVTAGHQETWEFSNCSLDSCEIESGDGSGFAKLSMSGKSRGNPTDRRKVAVIWA